MQGTWNSTDTSNSKLSVKVQVIEYKWNIMFHKNQVQLKYKDDYGCYVSSVEKGSSAEILGFQAGAKITDIHVKKPGLNGYEKAKEINSEECISLLEKEQQCYICLSLNLADPVVEELLEKSMIVLIQPDKAGKDMEIDKEPEKPVR
eukprot:UN31347